jgi:hypothetical protein
MISRAILGLLWLVPVVTSASTVYAPPKDELARRADAVVFGRVVTTRTLVSTTGVAVTAATFQVYDAVKGIEPGEVITVQMPGGESDGKVWKVAGAPRLAAGQMWLAFLNRHAEGVYTAWGMGYGLVPVRKSIAGELRVDNQRDVPALAGPAPEASGATLRFDDASLADVLRDLRGLVEDGPRLPSVGEGLTR